MVNWNLVLWKPVLCRSKNGNLVPIAWAMDIDHSYKGNLLHKILEMPIKKPISYGDAIRIFSNRTQEAFEAGDLGMKPGQYHWYFENFVSYISDLGFHIELTGDELETCGVSEVRT